METELDKESAQSAASKSLFPKEKTPRKQSGGNNLGRFTIFRACLAKQDLEDKEGAIQEICNDFEKILGALVDNGNLFVIKHWWNPEEI